MKIETKTDFKISDEARDAIGGWLYGNTHFDMDRNFTVHGHGSHKLKAIHLVETPPEGVSASPTTIDAIRSEKIPDTNYMLLEDEDGGFHDYTDCRQLVRDLHVYGVLFADNDGDFWVAHHDGEGEPPEPSADWPLIQVSRHSHEVIRENFGELADSIPSEGEFRLTRETPARVSWIPWWGEFGGAEFKEDELTLEALRERAADIRAEGGVVPDPDPDGLPLGTIEMPVRLQDWQTQSGGEPIGGEPVAIDLKITLSDVRYDIEAPDGRLVSVEFQDGNLRVMSYNGTSDGPVVSTIPAQEDITVDEDAFHSEKHIDLDIEP